MSVPPAIQKPSDQLVSSRGGPRLTLGVQTVLFFGVVMLSFTGLVIFTAEALLKERLAQNCRTDFEYFSRAISIGLENTLDGFRRELSLAASVPELYSKNSAQDAWRTAVKGAMNANPDFAWVAVIDADGKVAVATDGVMEGESVARRSWFTDLHEFPFSARLDGWPALTEELKKADRVEEAARRVFIGAPLKSASGRFNGAFVAQLGWDWARRVQRSVVPEGARNVQLGATVYAGPTEVLVDSGGSGWNTPPDAPEVPMARGSHGAKLERTADSGDYVTGYARSTKYPSLNWLVTVRQPTQHVFAPIAQLRRATVSWASLVIVICAGVSWYAAYRITRRLRSVKVAAQKIMAGDALSAMPIARDNSEVEEMCEAVSQLIEQLQIATPDSAAKTKRDPKI